jgi:hypothetical protein
MLTHRSASERDVRAGRREPGLPGDHMIVAFQQRDRLTVLDRMRADRRLTALHGRLKTPGEPNFLGPKKLGQIFRLRLH